MNQNKIHNLIFALMLIFVGFTNTVNAQSESDTIQTQQDSANTQDKTIEVIFECESCMAKNKFEISGMENFKFKKVIFPLKVKLKVGSYKMTYWQNKVRQIHLPFSVKPDEVNRIIVKK